MTQKMNILVVEDRDDWQDIVCSAISEAGLSPYAARTYDEALMALRAQPFDLAIVDPVLDMANPYNRDGLSVIQTIGRMQPATPVMIITGSLTHDLKTSLNDLCPEAPVLFKEQWDPATFGDLLYRTIGGDDERAAAPQGAPAALAGEAAAGPAPPSPQRAIGHPRVLLVENRQDWQNIVTGVLEDAGCFWRIATSAQEAQVELEKENFHLVILDLKLQEHELPLRSNEGWLLLDYLVESRPKTKVVILSGKADPSDVATLLTNYPLLSFIEKQRFNPQAIKDAIAQAVQAPELCIQSLGQFRLWRDGQAIEVWERPQAETLVKLLLTRRVRGGRTVAADELITRLWPDADEATGRKRLLPLISSARHTLEPDIEPRDSTFILRSTTGYFIDLGSNVEWDLLQFRQHLADGRQLARAERWEEAIDALQKGRSFYRGDYLAEDRYADWALNIRREIASEYRDLLLLLADANAALGRYPDAIEACEAALRKDPLLESAYHRLMRYHYCNGDKGQALKVYRDCLKVFEEMFGESPTPATRQLQQAIANDEVLEDCR